MTEICGIQVDVHFWLTCLFSFLIPYAGGRWLLPWLDRSHR